MEGLTFDRNRLLFDQNTDYMVWWNYLDENFKYSLPFDITNYNPSIDACKDYLYREGVGLWTIKIENMTTACVWFTDKRDAFICKLKFGGTII